MGGRSCQEPKCHRAGSVVGKLSHASAPLNARRIATSPWTDVRGNPRPAASSNSRLLIVHGHQRFMPRVRAESACPPARGGSKGLPERGLEIQRGCSPQEVRARFEQDDVRDHPRRRRSRGGPPGLKSRRGPPGFRSRGGPFGLRSRGGPPGLRSRGPSNFRSREGPSRGGPFGFHGRSPACLRSRGGPAGLHGRSPPGLRSRLGGLPAGRRSGSPCGFSRGGSADDD